LRPSSRCTKGIDLAHIDAADVERVLKESTAR
jgi:hypothetical protein